ncbi:hypothetical protein OS187_06470 [Xanthomonadaceae bacterium JHOS43]|nr:hypothetical protein [Xanthomonadaceae bacterium JHOS43]
MIRAVRTTCRRSNSAAGSGTTACLGLASTGGIDLSFTIEVHAIDGAGNAPGTLLGQLAASRAALGEACTYCQYDISALSLDASAGDGCIGVRWDPAAHPERYLCADESASTPMHTGFVDFHQGSGWEEATTILPHHRALLVRASTLGTASLAPVMVPAASPASQLALGIALLATAMVHRWRRREG